MEKDVRIEILTERHIKSFLYGLPQYSYPQFIYIDIVIPKKEIIDYDMIENSLGDIPNKRILAKTL